MNEKSTYEKLLADNKEMSKDLHWYTQNNKFRWILQSLTGCVIILTLFAITLYLATIGAMRIIEVYNLSAFTIACLQTFFIIVQYLIPLYIIWHFITVCLYTYAEEIASWYEKLKAKWDTHQLQRAKEIIKEAEQKSFDPPA